MPLCNSCSSQMRRASRNEAVAYGRIGTTPGFTAWTCPKCGNGFLRETEPGEVHYQQARQQRELRRRIFIGSVVGGIVISILVAWMLLHGGKEPVAVAQRNETLQPESPKESQLDPSPVITASPKTKDQTALKSAVPLENEPAKSMDVQPSEGKAASTATESPPRPGYIKLTSLDGRSFWGWLLSVEGSKFKVLHENGAVFDIAFERLDDYSLERVREEERKLPKLQRPPVVLAHKNKSALSLVPLLLDEDRLVVKHPSGLVSVVKLSELTEEAVGKAKASLNTSELDLMTAAAPPPLPNSAAYFAGLVSSDWKTATAAKLVFAGQSLKSPGGMIGFMRAPSSDEFSRLKDSPTIEQALAARSSLDKQRMERGELDPRMREVFFESYRMLGRIEFEVLVSPDAFKLWPSSGKVMDGNYFELRALPNSEQDFLFFRLRLKGKLETDGSYKGEATGDVVFRGSGDGSFGDGVISVNSSFTLLPVKKLP